MDGLVTESVVRDGETVTVQCSSTHLTSFACLVDVGRAQVSVCMCMHVCVEGGKGGRVLYAHVKLDCLFQIEDKALNIVSYIGLGISLTFLLLTIIFFLSFR